MDIKRMHCMIEKISKCADEQLEHGVEMADTEEMGKVIDMMKDLSEAMYYRTLTKAMDESNPEEVLEMFERYGDVGRKTLRPLSLCKRQIAPKGSGTYRRGYDEPPYYHMTPEKYHEMEDMRDMDRDKYGRMHYTEPSGNMHMNRKAITTEQNAITQKQKNCISQILRKTKSIT